MTFHMASVTGAADRVLWTSVILTGVFAYWYAPYYLNYVKGLVAVPIPASKPSQPQLQQDAEESIKSRTLAELAGGPNYNLAASAIKLTATRFIRDKHAKQDLLRDLSSKDWQRRDRAINGLRLLLTFPAVKDLNLRQSFVDHDTYSALVTALVNLLSEHEQHQNQGNVYTSPVRPIARSAHEQSILEALLILVDDPNQWSSSDFHIEYAQPAINAGIITKWLSRYPFPCTLPENERFNFKRVDVSRLLERDVWGDDDPLMSKLVKILGKVPSGGRQLVDVGLKESSVSDRTNIGSREWATRSHPTLTFQDYQPVPEWPVTGDSNDDNRADEEGQLIENEELLTRLGGPRSRDQSERPPGELSRQRRHRQAIVVAEAGVPLRPENILQRQPTETELAWQQEVQDRQGQILRPVDNRSPSAEELAVDQLARERIDGLNENRTSFLTFQLPDLDSIPTEELRDSELGAVSISGQENIPPEDNTPF